MSVTATRDLQIPKGLGSQIVPGGSPPNLSCQFRWFLQYPVVYGALSTAQSGTSANILFLRVIHDGIFYTPFHWRRTPKNTRDVVILPAITEPQAPHLLHPIAREPH